MALYLNRFKARRIVKPPTILHTSQLAYTVHVAPGLLASSLPLPWYHNWSLLTRWLALWYGSMDCQVSDESIRNHNVHGKKSTYRISSYNFRPWIVGLMYCDLWISKFKKEWFQRKLCEKIWYADAQSKTCTSQKKTGKKMFWKNLRLRIRENL